MSNILHRVGTLDEEASKAFRVRKTCLKMLSKRGYNVAAEDRDMTTEEFVDRFGEKPSRESLTILADHKESGVSDKIFVFFPDDEKVGVKQIKLYSSRMKGEGVKKARLVVKVNLTPAMKSVIREMSTGSGDRFRLEYFKDSELLVDITEHELVPEHIVLSNAEKKTLLNRYRLKANQLPKIQLSDPVARYYGLIQKQVVKIIRVSETAGRYITYRICV